MTTFNSSALCHDKDGVLLIIDIQERLGSAMPEKILHSISNNTQILTQAANALDIPVIVSEQYPKGLGATLSSISTCLTENTHKQEKTCFSCAGNTQFIDTLKQLNKKQIIITGMEAHICVTQTAIELQRQGYQAFIVADAVCSRKKTHYQNALQRMQQAGCIITNMESVCFEWLQDATHSQFKTIAKLIK